VNNLTITRHPQAQHAKEATALAERSVQHHRAARQAAEEALELKKEIESILPADRGCEEAAEMAERLWEAEWTAKWAALRASVTAQQYQKAAAAADLAALDTLEGHS